MNHFSESFWIKIPPGITQEDFKRMDADIHFENVFIQQKYFWWIDFEDLSTMYPSVPKKSFLQSTSMWCDEYVYG
jgi:hypothetical protein